MDSILVDILFTFRSKFRVILLLEFCTDSHIQTNCSGNLRDDDDTKIVSKS